MGGARARLSRLHAMLRVGRSYGRLASYGLKSYSNRAIAGPTASPRARTLQIYPKPLLRPRAATLTVLNQNPPCSPPPPLHIRTYVSGLGHAPSHRPSKDLYSIIGVSPNATQQQIKEQYYKLSMKYHPDRNKGSQQAHQKFTELTEAYSILGQHDLRRKYDKGLLQDYPRKSPVHPKQEQHHSATMAGKKMIYDFDEFYRAHYGESLKWQRKQTADKKAAAREGTDTQTLTPSMHRLLVIIVSLSVLVAGWRWAKYREQRKDI